MKDHAKKTCSIRFEPSGLKAQVPEGTVILEAARKVGVYLSSICGGDGYCGKCKVHVNEGQFQMKPTTLLTPGEIRADVVLACQTKIHSDMTLTVPKAHTLRTDQILMDVDTSRFSTLADKGAAEEEGFSFDPLVRKIYIEMSPPTVEDHTADYERLTVSIRNMLNLDSAAIQMGFRILQELPQVLQESDYKVTATIGFRGGTTEVVQVESGDRSGVNYAVAVDLGTTTVVAHLVDMTLGNTVDTEATYNSQINFGEDYIRRIIYAEQNDAFDEMQAHIVNDVNGLIVTLAERNQVSLHDITAVVCAGNTAMTHFLLNLDSKRIRREPYIASASSVPPIRAAEAGIQINKRGLLYCLPSIAAYVGGDIVAGVLAVRLDQKEGLSLFVDIGTNGEVVLGNKDWMMCASSSAGPAFEGSGVRHGMRAGNGAIEKLQIDDAGNVVCQTIGDAPAVGICGSGLLDTLAELFLHGVIDRTGRFQALADPRIDEGEDGLEFTLVEAKDGGKKIVITQADIDNLIRSKAGVFAAIRSLMETTQTKTEELDAVYLAGGFGNYMSVDRAVTVGILPDVPVEKIHSVGNTSLAGAKTVLLSRQGWAIAEEIAAAMTYTDLMSHAGYMEEFIKANFLPHTDLSLFPSQELVS